jgi:SH3-like domain-containing protein
MRLAVLLLLALPAYAMAQTAPSPSVLKPPSPPLHPPAAAPHPAPAAPHQAATAPAKPTPPKPAQAKPGDHKPPPKSVRKPPAPAPHPAPVAPAPAPAAVEPPPAEPGKGSNTGLPLPRFAALRSDDVNFRSGPGTRYPIDWVYKRRDLPVKIEREFEIWRLVEDPFGVKGWVNQATLSGRRTAVVAGSERVLRQAASDTAGPVATLKPGVIVRLRACEANSEWCQAQIADYRGYIKRGDIWGLLPGEVIQ